VSSFSPPSAIIFLSKAALHELAILTSFLLSFTDWAMPPVPQMSHLEYVPMFWGPSQWGSWNDRLQEMYRNHPKHVMAFNEPDVSSQSNMNPYEAAQIFMEQIQPWANRGALLGSPAIVWDLNWMATFLEQIHHKGGDVHFICLHWCGTK
jgi:hypothetical protein